MKVYLDMVGCRLNQGELENYALQFRMAGHSLTDDPQSADLLVINTCTVTSAAASDSRQKIRQAIHSGASQVIVTGCWSTVNPNEAAQIPGVTRIITNQEKDNLVPMVLNLPIEEFDHHQLKRMPIPGARLRTRAFIKVQDGCDNYCTYCITRVARGVGKSRPVADILEDVQSALNGGTKEIVITGVHLGSWGYDFTSPMHLASLVKAILDDTDTPRLRLSSLEPWDIPPDFFKLWQNPRLCRQVHLPLQSGCEATLKRMGRRVTPEVFASLVQQARACIPDVAITTDIISGFPGESDAEFSESADFVTAMEFAGGHVFTYSSRPGTPAANLPKQVPFHTSRQRNYKMREILSNSAATFRERHLGQSLQVLWEKAKPSEQGWELTGLSDNYLHVAAHSLTSHYNQLMEVVITGIDRGVLQGEITCAESEPITLQDTL